MRILGQAVAMTIVLAIVTGIGYPLLVCGIAEVIFPAQANGSLLAENGKLAGSTLIGQNFSQPKYFHPRPSAAGNGYDASNSGGSNLAPTNKSLIDAVRQRVAAERATVLQRERRFRSAWLPLRRAASIPRSLRRRRSTRWRESRRCAGWTRMRCAG